MRVKRLKGRWSHLYSLRVNNQYRIVFGWRDGHAEDVQLMDYH